MRKAILYVFLVVTHYPTESLIYGQCYTLVPQVPVDNVGKFFGYAINVTYDDNQQFTDDDEDIDDYKLFGWHIFIHETEHKFDGNDL